MCVCVCARVRGSFRPMIHSSKSPIRPSRGHFRRKSTKAIFENPSKSTSWNPYDWFQFGGIRKTALWSAALFQENWGGAYAKSERLEAVSGKRGAVAPGVERARGGDGSFSKILAHPPVHYSWGKQLVRFFWGFSFQYQPEGGPPS